MFQRLLLLLAAALSAFGQTLAPNIDNRIAALTNEVSTGDYMAAQLELHRLRNEIGRGIRVDGAAMRQVLGNQDRITDSQVVLHLREAGDKANAGDRTGALSAIDTALAELTVLYGRANPTTLYAKAKSAVDEEVAERGRARSTTLHEAARLGYRSGEFRESLAYALREMEQLRANPAPSVHGWFVHLSHTVIGLDALAIGEDQIAASELKASLADAQDYVFTTGPTMALAKALVAKQPDAVVSYLDDCAKLTAWHGREAVERWKSQIKSGAEPDFGAQASQY